MHPKPFNPLDNPICFEKPHRLTDVTFWHWHIPFAFILVAVQKPALLVELGTHKGDSYCAFCQAVSALKLPTTCFAIDCWEGDAHAGYYGPEIYQELKLYHDPHYGSFSTLLKSYFDDALGYFKDGSIDVLHIDGHHSYESVLHDFNAWLPRMSARGVVLLHDINVRERQFGVWRLWDELKERYPHFGFAYGSGLGVLLVGDQPLPATRDLIDTLNAEGSMTAEFFYAMGYTIFRDSEIRGTFEEIAKLRQSYVENCQELQRKEDSLRKADEWLKAAYAELAQAGALIEKREKEFTLQEADLRSKLESSERLLHEIFHSKGWLWLTRARKFKQHLQGLKKKTILNPVRYRTDDKTYHARVHHPILRKRPRVLHAIGNLFTGGSSRLVVDLIEHLGHKYEQQVICGKIPDPVAYDGFKFHDFSEPVTVEAIAAFLKKYRPHILHFHYWREPWYQKIVAAAEQVDCMVVENINTPVIPIVHPKIDHYVFVSNYAMHLGSEPPKNASVIYPGSNLALFQRNGTPIPEDTIGMVYRLDFDKLNEDAIQVFIQVVRLRPQTKVYIVGGGAYFETYQNQVREAGLASNFIFTGYVPYHRLPEYYAKLSVFVAPVHTESFGQVSPFAMSMQLPVAGYDVGALSEILGGSECLGQNQDELAAIIVDLLNDRDKRIAIGRRNAERVARMFAVEAMIESYDSLYQRLLKSKGIQ